MFHWLLAGLLLIVPFFILRALLPRPSSGKVRTTLVLGSGGHTAELLGLIGTLDPLVYSPRTYYLANTDKLSEQKAKVLEEKLETGEYSLVRVPRAREVGQSLISSLPSTLLAVLACFPPLVKAPPQLLLCNGPGTCLPLIILARLFSIVHPCTIDIIIIICNLSAAVVQWAWHLPAIDHTGPTFLHCTPLHHCLCRVRVQGYLAFINCQIGIAFGGQNSSTMA